MEQDAGPGETVPTRRRVPRLLVGTALVVALVATSIWLWLPHYRPGLKAGETYGIDVSAHQGAVDWPAVARDGISFAYLKAGEGGDFVDRSFAENRRGAAAAGLEVGAYHFFTLCRPGSEQAEHFLSVAPPAPDVLASAVDLELNGNCGGRWTLWQVSSLAAVDGVDGRVDLDIAAG